LVRAVQPYSLSCSDWSSTCVWKTSCCAGPWLSLHWRGAAAPQVSGLLGCRTVLGPNTLLDIIAAAASCVMGWRRKFHDVSVQSKAVVQRCMQQDN
jgi:hypothetical protein